MEINLYLLRIFQIILIIFFFLDWWTTDAWYVPKLEICQIHQRSSEVDYQNQRSSSLKWKILSYLFFNVFFFLSLDIFLFNSFRLSFQNMPYESLFRPKAILEGGETKRWRYRRGAFKKTAREFEFSWNFYSLLFIYRKVNKIIYWLSAR